MDSPVRTRFCIPAGGPLHIGAARIALLNWLTARGAGGRFVLRIDDVGCSAGASREAEQTLEDLRWLGLDWDEGPDTGGPYGPYRQILRLGVYEPHCDRLVEAGWAYHSFDRPEELERMRREALAAWRPFRYPRPTGFAAAGAVERARLEGRPVVLRFRMPGRDITIDDRILGPVRIAAEEMDDPVIRDENGLPTRLLTDVIDDARMGITHLVCGQEQLPWAHRQAAMREALGFHQPACAHVPLILNPDGTRLSRRDRRHDTMPGRPGRSIDVRDFRSAGYLPEVLARFVSLLGWSPHVPSEYLSMADIARLFDLTRISLSAATFRREDLLAWNAEALAAASEDRLLAGLRDYMQVNDTPLRTADEEGMRGVIRLVRGRRTFREFDRKCSVLFVGDEEVVYDERAVRKVLVRGEPRGFDLLAMAHRVLSDLAGWDAERVAHAIRLVAGQGGLDPRRFEQSIRVAVTGSAGNLPIGLMLGILGKARVLNRITRCLAMRERADAG